MKKLIYSFIVFLSMAFLPACNKVLDKRPLDAFDENTVWSDRNLAVSYVYTTYNSVISGLYYNQNYDDWTDNSVLNGANNTNAENFDNFTDFGWNRYGMIRRCNVIIQKLNQSTGITDLYKNQMIGEAKFLRGIIYARQARLFGGVMIVDSVLDYTEDLQLPRKSIKETYDFILKDLQEATALLPATAETGRATKGAANAFITRVGLQAAAYIPQNKAAYLTMVVNAAQAIINSGIYTLDPDYGALFNDYDKSLASKEYILGYFRSSTNTTFQGTPMQGICPNSGPEKVTTGYGPPLVESFEGWPGRFPSQDLIDAYLVKDADAVAKKWNQTSYYTNYTNNGGYASSVLYKNRDNRFYSSIVYDSTILYKNFVLTRALGNMNMLGNNTGWGNSPSNYYFKKGLYEKVKLWYADPTNYAVPIIRLGEVYLNYAEALLLQGDAPAAIDQINQTRVTHGKLSPIPAGISVADLWPVYKDERRVELLREDDRYWSLLRWGKFENKTQIAELSTPVRRVDISADGKTFAFPVVSDFNNANRVFTSKRFLMPVPQGEIQANPNLAPNNEGW